MSSETTRDPAGVTGLPTKPILQRPADTKLVMFSPTDATRFLFDAPGQVDFSEATAARGDSVPLHRHPWATFEFIIEGRIRYSVDGEEFVAETGDFVYTPPNAVHSFIIESDIARVVGFNYPGSRFAELQRRAEPMLMAPTGPDMGAVMALAGELGVELLGPPMELRS